MEISAILPDMNAGPMLLKLNPLRAVSIKEVFFCSCANKFVTSVKVKTKNMILRIFIIDNYLYNSKSKKK